MLWHDPSSTASRVRLSYYAKKGDLYRIRKGLYAKDRHYNRLELATRIFTPSYVSFETVLAKEGLIFQYYEEIFVASYLNREISVDGQVYSFRKLKTSLLVNAVGVQHVDETSIASRERAFLDTLYANKDYHFDNLSLRYCRHMATNAWRGWSIECINHKIKSLYEPRYCHP